MKSLYMSSVFCLAIVLCGCGPSTENITTPAGATALSTTCSDSTKECLDIATNTCKGSYDVLDSYSKSGDIFDDTTPGPITWYHLIYTCGRTSGTFPQFPFRGQQYIPSQSPIIIREKK